MIGYIQKKDSKAFSQILSHSVTDVVHKRTLFHADVQEVRDIFVHRNF